MDVDALQVEEYKAVRASISQNIDIVEKSEIYAIGAVAATMAFSAASPIILVAKVSSILPGLISGLGLIRYLGLDEVIGKANNYIQTKYESVTPAIGWSGSYRNQPGHWLKWSRIIIWKALIIISLLFTLLTWFYAPFTAERKPVGQDKVITRCDVAPKTDTFCWRP